LTGDVAPVGMNAGWTVDPEDRGTAAELTALAEKQMYGKRAARHEEGGLPVH
jgi:hypothetical protein